MGNTGRWLLIVSLLMLLPAAAHAQEEENLKAFLADDSPALLFQVSELSLQSWNGGVGMMFSVSEDMHWRFSLAPKFSGSVNSSSDTIYGPPEENRTTLGVGIAGGPIWVLYRRRNFCVTAGPEFGYEFRTEDHESIRRGTVQGDWTTTSHILSLRGAFGAGFALSPSIALHAEYLFGGAYQFDESENRLQYGTSELSSWSLMTSARLGLIIRL